jgi:hypothetical protein
MVFSPRLRAAFRADFHGHLIGRAADPAGANFQGGRNVLKRRMEHSQGIHVAALGLDDIKGAIDNVLRHGLLTFVHDVVHELGEDEVSELGVGKNIALLCAAAAGHGLVSLVRFWVPACAGIICVALVYFGRLAP